MVYVFGLIAVLTASFIPFIIISSLIIIHELGHFLTAKALNVEVDKIYLYPLGGISKFFLPLNSSYIKELIILFAGPIAQSIAKSSLLIIFPRYSEIINTYHYGILIFNLLPIYPLDGGKLLQIILSKFMPYKSSYKISILISYITISIYLILSLPLKINSLIITIFLISKVYREQEQIKYIYEKFLLERYLTKYHFKNSKLVNNSNDFYKNHRHIIKINNGYILEKDYLIKKYKKN